MANPNPQKLEDHPLSSVRECLFNIFPLPSILEAVTPSQSEDAPCRGDRDPLLTDVEYIPTVLFLPKYYKYTVNKHTILTTELYIAQNVGMLSVTLHRYWPGIQ